MKDEYIDDDNDNDDDVGLNITNNMSLKKYDKLYSQHHISILADQLTNKAMPRDTNDDTAAA